MKAKPAMNEAESEADFVPATSVSRSVAEWLSRRILSGVLAPGEPLVEARIARDLGISRAPVREAIQRLANEGVIELIPRRSPVVAGFSIREYHDLYNFRMVVEGYVFRDFALVAMEEDFAALDAIVARSRRCHENGDLIGFRSGVAEFHHYIYSRTPNKVASREAFNLWRRTARYRNLVAHREGASKRSLRWHGSIAKAIRAGDGAAVQALVNEMLTTVRDEGLPFLDQLRRDRPEIQVDA
jgi:DNA-binding GntR family transcriptional regulator